MATEYGLIQEMLSTSNFAVNRPLLEDRLHKTTDHLLDGIRELMKPENQQIPKVEPDISARGCRIGLKRCR